MTEFGLALPFSLGLVTAINPCGFAMLPTWLGYFIGRDAADHQARSKQVARGLSVSLLLTVSFVAIFGLLGLVVSHLANEEAIARRTPWVTIGIGLMLIPYGLALLTGRGHAFRFMRVRRAPHSTEIWSILVFGISYAVISVGCAAPLFFLHVAGSFSRDGVLGGTASYLAFGVGMASIVTLLTLSIAMARGGLARNLRLLLPFIDRLGALALTIGGAYLVVYGIYEVRLLNGSQTAANPIVNAVNDLQSHLVAWATEVNTLQVGLALWLAVMTLVAWGLRPGLSQRAQNAIWLLVMAIWLLAEGFAYQGDLLVLPITRVVAGWPSRASGWFTNPTRWAVPLEVLLTSTVLLTAVLTIRATTRKHQ